MKTLYTLILLVCFSAFAKADTNTHNTEEVTAVNWTGTYTTDWGEVILYQKGSNLVGTYSNKGAIRGLVMIGNTLRLEFDNGSRTGLALFTKTSKGFMGTYGWDKDLKEGAWNGTLKGGATQKALKGTWDTNFMDLDLLHNSSNIVAGFYGSRGGMIWGKYNPSTKMLTGKYTTKTGAKRETFQMQFSGDSFRGKYNNTAMGSWTGSRKKPAVVNEKAYLLKVTLNQLKFNKSNEVGKRNKLDVALISNMKINGRDVPARNKALEKTSMLYKDYDMRTWEVGEVRTSNNDHLVFHIAQELIEIDNNDEFQMHLAIRDKPRAPAMVVVPRGVVRDINLKEVLKFLSGNTSASQYPIVQGHNGRRRFPNSPDSFWLETIGGKRYVRGYGDLLMDEGKLRFGYHYTIELVN